MSPAMQSLFMAEIAPILAAAVPRSVAPVGAEDARELVQDAMAEACRQVHLLEERRQPVIPRSVAYYAIQRLKSGRRSTGAGRTDVMSPGCRLDGRSTLQSMEEPAGADGDLRLGDLLACRRDDPAQEAARNADWSEFMELLDERQRTIVKATAEGESLTEQAARLGVWPSAVFQRKEEIAKRARAFWGDQVLADAAEEPLWRRTQRQR